MCAKNTQFAKAMGFLDNPFDPTNSSTMKEMRSQNEESNRRQAQLEGQKLDPLAPPDLTDDTIRKARVAQLMRTRMARGRSASFLTDPTAT